jgi:hypothetical protein
MNRIDFTKPGGLVLTQETLNFMQSDYILGLNALASACAAMQGSPFVILSGCEQSGNTVSPGVCAVNGEPVYCAGGSGNYVCIVETTQNASFNDGIVKPVYFTRILAFQSGAGQIAWSAFVRIPKLATSTQGAKADSAIQSATIGGAAVTKAGTQLQLPAYPTRLPASGGDAATVGGKAPGAFAASAHTHLFKDITNLMNFGTWTPVSDNLTIEEYNSCQYSRIGDMVFISGYIRVTISPGSASANINGLPYYAEGLWEINAKITQTLPTYNLSYLQVGSNSIAIPRDRTSIVGVTILLNGAYKKYAS